MDVLIKIAAVAIAGSVLGLVIKKSSPEMAILLTIALSVFSLVIAYSVIRDVLDFIKAVSESAEIAPSILSVVLKTVGISVIAKIASDVCKDAGQSSVASGVELAGAIAAIYIALPLFETVLKMINSLL